MSGRRRRGGGELPVPRYTPPLKIGKVTAGLPFRPGRQSVDDLTMRPSSAPRTSDLSAKQKADLQEHFKEQAEQAESSNPILFADFDYKKGGRAETVNTLLEDWTVHRTVDGYFHKLMVLYNNTGETVTCTPRAEIKSPPEVIEGSPPLIFEPSEPISIEPGEFQPVLMKVRAGLASQLSSYSDKLLEQLLPIKQIQVIDNEIERLKRQKKADDQERLRTVEISYNPEDYYGLAGGDEEEDDVFEDALSGDEEEDDDIDIFKLECKKRSIIQNMLDHAGYSEPSEEADYESDAKYRHDHWEDIHETILKPREQYLARLEASGIFIHVDVSGGKTYKFECSPKRASRAGFTRSLQHNMGLVLPR